MRKLSNQNGISRDLEPRQLIPSKTGQTFNEAADENRSRTAKNARAKRSAKSPVRTIRKRQIGSN